MDQDFGELLPPYIQDIYSLGMVSCDMMAKELPKRADIANKKISFHDVYSPQLIELVYSMLDKDPAQRPTIIQVLQHPLLF